MLYEDPEDVLLSLSENQSERYVEKVNVHEWEELKPWGAVKPFCRYVCATPDTIRRKRVQKLKRNEDILNSINFKNRKPKLSPKNKFDNKDQCKRDLPFTPFCPIQSAVFEWSHQSTMNACKHNQNNSIFRSYNTLSYKNPSWRFLVNFNSLDYIERCHPKDMHKYYDMNTKSLAYLWDRKRQLRALDPAAFLDEQLASAFAATTVYLENNRMKEMLNEIADMKEFYSQIVMEPSKRLLPVDALSTSYFHVKLPKIFESTDQTMGKSTKEESKSTRVNKSKSRTKDKKPKKRKSKHKRQVNKSVSDKSCDKETVIDVADLASISGQKHLTRRLQSPTEIRRYSEPIVQPIMLQNKMIQVKKKCVQGDNELYLPTLSYSNYPNLDVNSSGQDMNDSKRKLKSASKSGSVIKGVTKSSSIKLQSASNSGSVSLPPINQSSVELTQISSLNKGSRRLM